MRARIMFQYSPPGLSEGLVRPAHFLVGKFLPVHVVLLMSARLAGVMAEL